MGDEREEPDTCSAWGRDQVDCLLGLNERLDPSLKRKATKEVLLREWMVLQPTLPLTGTVLAARLRWALQERNPSLSVPGAATLHQMLETKREEVPSQ